MGSGGVRIARAPAQHDERVLVVRGASIHATIVRSGDFLLMRGDVNDVSAATAGQAGLEFITRDGPFDFMLALESAGDETAH